MKLKTLGILVFLSGVALPLTGCNDPYDGPAYASVTIGTPIGRPHYRDHGRHRGWKPRYEDYNDCHGRRCRPMRPHR